MIVFDPVIEFYITNECNLACTNCNRFNDHAFRGHYWWNDWAQDIEAWSHRIDAKQFTIIGGEPSLHPELETWVSNLRRLWPNTQIVIQSNGVNKYYQDTLMWRDKYQAIWSVSAHSKKQIHKLRTQWEPDANNVASVVIDNTEFTTATVIADNNGFKVHCSDAELAFNNCTMRYSHTLFRGRLYKCPVTAILPEFMTQHQVNMTDQQLDLLNSYRSLGPNCSDQELEEFAASRNKHIKQCAICPEQANFKPVIFHKRI